MATVASQLLVVAAGLTVVAGTLIPWVYDDGESVIPLREGLSDGALAAFLLAFAVAQIAAATVALLRSRPRPRFTHAITLVTAPPLLGLTIRQYQRIDHDAWLARAVFHPSGYTGPGAGFTVVFIGLAVGGLAPLLGARQAWRVLRS